MATVSDFKIRIDVEGQVEINNLKKSLDDTQKSFDKVGSSASKASVEANKYGQVVGNLRGTLQGAITTGNGFTDSLLGSFGALGRVASGAALAVTALVGLGARAINVADQISDISKATDISSSRLLSFKASVIEAGGSADDFATIAFKLNQSLADAAAGNETVRRNFERLGVAIYDSGGQMRSTDAIFADIITNFRNGKIGSEEMAAAIDLLGKSISRLDVTQLQAVNDPFKDAQIAQLEKYKGAIERLGNQIDESLIKVFGGAALAITDYLDQLDKMERNANEAGRTFRNPTEGFFGGQLDIVNGLPRIAPSGAPLSGEINPLRRFLGPRIMSPAELAELNRQRMQAQLTEVTVTGKRVSGIPPLTADQKTAIDLAKNQSIYIGRSSEAQIKLLKAVRDTLTLSKVDADIAKSRLEIDTQTQQKTLALRKERDNLLANNKEDKRIIDAKVEAIDKEIRGIERIGAEQKKNKEAEIRNAERLRQLQADINLANEKLTSQISTEYLKSQNDLIGLFGDELTLKRGLLDIENERLQKIQQIANEIDRLGVDATDADRERAAKRIETANKEAADKEAILKDSIERQNELENDWRRSVKQKMEDLASSISPAQLGIDLFGSAISSVDRALTDFVEKGKFSFKDFARSLLRDMALIIARAIIMRAILSMFGLGGFTPSAAVSSSFNAMPGMVPAAKGGTARTNQPYMVGELGPEMFIPRSAGSIIPTNQLAMASAGGTTVNYNISAVDAASFRSLVARDPQFIYNVTEVGRRSNPARRLA